MNDITVHRTGRQKEKNAFSFSLFLSSSSGRDFGGWDEHEGP
jgi:hypothetical protein